MGTYLAHFWLTASQGHTFVDSAVTAAPQPHDDLDLLVSQGKRLHMTAAH